MAGKSAGPWPKASGFAMAVVVFLQLGIGVYLNFHYSVTTPHESVQAIRNDSFKAVLQNIHYWGSAWLIAHGFLHLLLLVLTGSYLAISKWAWLGSVMVFGSSFMMQVSGNLLPFDRHDVQTAVIESSVARGMPLIGTMASSRMLGGSSFNSDTVSVWHQAHLWLTIPLVLGALICAFGYRRSEGKGPLRFFWAAVVLSILGLSLALPAPYGPGATQDDFGSFSAMPSWYTWGMHGALNTFERLSSGLGWVGSGLLPGLFGLFLLLAPWMGAKKDGLVRALFVVFFAGFALMAWINGGRLAPITGNQEEQLAPSDPVRDFGPVDEAKAAKGHDLSTRLCTPCHGADLTGDVGPNLFEVYKERRNSQWLMEFIRDPKSKNPGSRMKPFTRLTEEELAQVAEWLRKPK